MVETRTPLEVQDPRKTGGYKPIESYGVIGDLHTVALVGSDGSIDWCCLPHFDSPSVFAAILDAREGGFFKIAPVHPAVCKQMYLPETNVLLTRFLSEDGVGEVTDFMPMSRRTDSQGRCHQIIRRVQAVRGRVKFRLECFPAFDYGRVSHRLRLVKGAAVFSSEVDCLGLVSPVQLRGVRRPGSAAGKGDGVTADFTLRTGETLFFVLREAERDGKGKPHPAGLIEASCESGQVAFHATGAFWRRWLAGCRYQGRWREMVQRSALTLKLLTFEPTGAIVAAPTTSLPERIGGARNWDYRYTWIRDAAFTVYAFLRLGLTEEAEAFIRWIDARAHEGKRDGSLQIMYGINGEHTLVERELKHLEGYRGSAPVRIGNAAYRQRQLDIYGELLDSIYLANKYSRPISDDLWRHLRRLLGFVCEHWRQPDEGIWEIRGGRFQFVYSKMMCWVALDRGLRLADKRSFPADRTRWMKTRDAIYQEIMTRGWNEKRGAFVQHYDSDALDASNLLMPLTFFIAPNDPRMESTLDATMKSLTADSLVYRYQIGRAAPDGLPGEEGAFSMCSFWLVEALTRAGRLEEARLLFEKMLTYANHLGLYAEQIGLRGEALGNFPQAFTHLGLISAAVNLDRRLGA